MIVAYTCKGDHHDSDCRVQLKYVTDLAGKRKEVIVPFPVWTSLTNELEALKEKQEILLGLRQACQEVKRQQQGTLKEKTLYQFLDER